MKKHSIQEILQKLGQADDMVQAGKSQVEICDVLGVSVMTFHRWRKLRQTSAINAPLTEDPAEPLLLTNRPTVDDLQRVLDELTLENKRLRKIVTDLLLEKARMEEQNTPRVVDLEHHSH